MGVYKLVISVLSVLSIILLSTSFFLDPNSQIYKLLDFYDFALCIVFFYDFLKEFIEAKNKKTYFFTVGWLDLLSSIPVINELRFARAFKVFRIFRIIKSMKFLLDFIKENKKGSVYALIVVTITLFIIINSILVLYFEKNVGNIRTAEDTLWWTFITITTVGYGDYYPITKMGKVCSAILTMNGLFGFGVFINYMGEKLNKVNPNLNDNR